MFFSTLAAALFLLETVQATCPAGTIYNANFDKCYKYVSQPATYLVAEESCKSMGGYLVTIGNSFENSYIGGVAEANFWIGLNYLLANTWTWVDGTSAPYSHWAPGQPSDPSTKQCAMYNYGSGQWTKEMCNVQHAYFCDIDPNAIHGNSLNIPANPPADPNNAPQYAAYQQAVSEFTYSVNFSASPCNDFYNYACGNYKKQVSIYDMTDNNYNNMVSQLTSPAYQSTVQASTALTKEKKFFDACKSSLSNSKQDNQTRVQKNYLYTKVMTLQSYLGSAFTTVYGGSAIYPTPKQLANALGYLSFVEGIDTYISPYVDTYWRDNTKGNLFFVDQNTCELPKTYYAPNVFPTIKNSYIDRTVGVLQDYCSEQGIPCPSNLKSKVQDLINFEQIIAYNYSTDDTTRRQANRNWNPQTFNQAQSTYSFIDWSAYISNIPYAAARSRVQAAGYNFDLMEPAMTQKLSKELQGYGAEKVVNYLYMRLILDSSQYLPSYGNSFEKMPKLERTPKIGIDRRDRKQKRKPISVRNMDAASPVEQQCIELADDLLQYANGRVFIDKIYPDQASRKAIRDTAGGLIKNVVNSFQGMLEQLDWMDDSTKLRALDKTNNIIKNIAFPDWITDNSQLDNYYSLLDISFTTDFYTMWDLLIQFNLQLEYKKLMTVPADRNDFQAGPGVVNAWYQPEFNSITLAAGMLQPPFFHQNFPTSMNYGGIGIVSGHELTHGFDDQGVQWDPTGNLPSTPWMDTNSSTGFNQMANCVINEYSNFCPLDAAKYTPNCINGAQTQGENIADNGGIHAAFRAYRTHIALDGPDPVLPDPVFSQFTHDQLFFLNYGQIWCEAPVNDGLVYRQLMTDPHSPALYRVFGTIQNFPAFRVAYNCPVGSSYSPVDHCRVWVPNVEN